MHRLIYIIILSAVAIISGCNRTDSSANQVAMAELAMADDDVSATRQICDGIMNDSIAKSGIAATEMARLSILYMQLYERTDDHEAVDLAAECYRESFLINSDSARLFFESLPPDHIKYVMALSSIVSSIDNPYPLDSLGEFSHEFADSI